MFNDEIAMSRDDDNEQAVGSANRLCGLNVQLWFYYVFMANKEC